MKKALNAHVPRLEERFEFQDEAIVIADQVTFRSSVYRVAERATGAERALRVWKKTGTSADADLRALWIHERRQVQRLMATAGGSGVVVNVLEFVEDDREFAAVLEDAGQPLSRFRERSSAHQWIRNLASARNRMLLWRNCARIAEALGMLHGQGIIHGHLGPDVVMTNGGQVPDFKLTGFEWSLWFAAPSAAHSRAPILRPGTGAPVAYSFAVDWKGLGVMMAGLLGLTLAGDGGVTPSGNAVDTTGGERSLIRRLVAPARSESLDAGSILQAIEDVVSGLERNGAVRGGTFILLVPDTSGLGEAAARATGGEIDPGDSPAHVAWAQADLANGAVLVVPAGRAGTHRPPMLQTQMMRYRLRPGEIPGEEPTWNIAYCQSARLRSRDIGPDWEVETHPVTQPVEVVDAPRRARDLRARLGPAALDWATLFGAGTVDEADAGVLVRRALVLVQAIEGVILALDALPVQVIDSAVLPGECSAAVRARPHSERDDIARALGLATTADSLHRIFVEERREGEERWTLGPTGSLGGDRRADQPATFRGEVQVAGVPAYSLELDAPPETGTALFLRGGQDVGTEQVFTRRVRNIAALGDLPTLSSMLEDPWSARKSVASNLDEDAAFDALDAAKQAALRGIRLTSPMYCVVGPPGVGKTHLATEVTRRELASDGSGRVLLTAQGHDALDNLQDAVEKLLRSDVTGNPLMVRVASEQRQRPRHPGDSLHQVAEMLAFLSRSNEAHRWPAPFRDRIANLAEAASSGAERAGQGDHKTRAEVHSATDLLLDAANVVVATTNSSAVARMVAERAQFDTVIVEEAAKAAGPELVGVLALSGRLLLIGDHNQLPPFNADTFERVLGDHSLTVRVIEVAERLTKSLFPDGELEDLRKAATMDGGVESIRGLAYRLVQFFRTVAEGDERKKAGNPNHRPLSTILDEQRRMHPAVAELVSRAFYKGTLRTTEKRQRDAYSEALPFACDLPLPASPLVVIDFDHVMATGRTRPMERDRKRWHSPDEAQAVIDVLRLVRPQISGKIPTVAVLSPYSAQVELLRQEIGAARRAGGLALMDGFEAAREHLDIVGTVDSFQGAEADLVVVSLVRNNPRVGMAALGFLRDRRRMNVLLSRSKAKLVLVTSLSFLREATAGAPAAQRDELAFIRSILGTIGELRERDGPDGIPLASVVRPADLRVGP